MSRIVLYLSNAMFPGNMNNPFLQQEQPLLVDWFDRAYYVSYKGWTRLSEDTETPYAFRASKSAVLSAWIKAPFRKELWQELAHLLKDGKLTPVNAAKLCAFTVRGLKMHHWAEEIIAAHPQEEITLYAFWLSYDGYAAALSRQKHPAARFVARGHYFDIDVRRNAMNPYLMKTFIAEKAEGVYLIARTVKEWLVGYMGKHLDERKAHVLALGSAGEAPEHLPLPKRFCENVLHVVSCSRVVPIKRLDVIVDALAAWKGMPVLWTHIGDGSERERMQAYAEEKLDQKENVVFRFTGNMQPAQIHKLYEETPFDAFLNTSEGEGVPVSIMEAMRCGIPAIAADVGATKELVADGCGWTFAFEDGADGVIHCLKELCALNEAETMAVRHRAQEQWKQGFQSRKLLATILRP